MTYAFDKDVRGLAQAFGRDMGAATARIDAIDVPSLSFLMQSTRGYLPVGTSLLTRAEGFSYEVVSSDPDLTTAGGIMLRVRPSADGLILLAAWGVDATGATDCSIAFQQAFNRIPGPEGGTIVLPRGRVLLNAMVWRKLNAGGALGRAIAIVGSVCGNTTVVVGHANAGIYLEGPTGSFASGVECYGFRMEAATPGIGTGLRLTGIARSDISVQFRNLNVGLECEAALISKFHIRAEYCNIGVYLRKEGHFGGDWGVSGCNENHFSGDLGMCKRYGMIADTIRGITLDMHVERCGDVDIAGGGVHNTSRGGVWFINPAGTLRMRGSSEDCGRTIASNAGTGVVYAYTDGTSAERWTLDLQGWNFFGTLGRPDHFVTVGQHASAGYGSVVMSGVTFRDNAAYTPAAARDKIKIGATAANMRCVLEGVSMTHASTEMSWNASTDYVVINSPDIGPDSQIYVRGSGAFGQVIEGTFSDASLTLPANTKVSLSGVASTGCWIRFSTAANAFQIGTGASDIKHTFSLA
ncbi:hypothetical protein [Paracoccus sulfuroxidans]|uniref:Pectate lyase-like protein n=1 Tax=Paracoccus sulfuroxidans TaxID=384678 RepID=A0A562NKL5_9RHOB|nr:hypothetical protein [Paracoccus sulfuroxidans]TWI32749.1 hypothetical protein IQ24_02624 [Paracoccus sulfuroxidans]